MSAEGMTRPGRATVKGKGAQLIAGDSLGTSDENVGPGVALMRMARDVNSFDVCFEWW